MKTNTLLFIATMAIALFACQSKEQKVELVRGLSIVIPQGFELEEKQTTEMKIQKAHYQSQNIFCSSAPLSIPDTLTSEMVTSILRLNTERFIEPFDGEEISINGAMIANAEAFEFDYTYVRNEQIYQVHGRSFIYNDHMHFITYEAPYPSKSSIDKRISSFFKSVQID